MFTETPEAQAIIAWHDSQTEEFLASLPGYEDGLTPRQAWEAFCSLPATKQPGEGLAAPAVAGQGAGTLLRPSVHLGFELMLGMCACGSWRSFCDHGIGTFAMWGVIRTRSERRA